ncbi:MAG: hypothetical protein KDI31_01050 [Pseudomonadales bacterium]|nr:hypothetical protein [Pseudomonadales bacterium]
MGFLLNKTLSAPAFLFMLSAGLILASLVVALVVNRIEAPPFAPDFPLPWDPTHTARKYLVLAALALAGAFIWRRYRPAQGRILLLPALLLTLAVPFGTAGYEGVAHDWGWSAWMEGDPDRLAELRSEPFAYLADPDAELTTVVLIRDDTLQLGRLAVSMGGGDHDGLQGAAKAKVDR